MYVEDSRKMTARENNENQQWKINYAAGRVVRSFETRIEAECLRSALANDRR